MGHDDAGDISVSDRCGEVSMATDRKHRPARIKDVAAAAGVSFKTVSNVVHGRPNVGPETRQRVLAAIAELAYRPDPAARQLRQGRTNTLTLVVPEITSPYFAQLAHLTIDAAREYGYAVFLEETGGDPQVEQDLLSNVAMRIFDGIIFSPLSATAESLSSFGRTVPSVYLGEHIDGIDIDHLAYDNVASVRDATRHLIDTGRRRIAFLGMQSGNPNHTVEGRLTGYRQALTDARLPMDRRMALRAVDYSREEGAVRTAEALHRGLDFDGLICANDTLAIGALYSLRLAGREVPGDVAVVGWDNIPEGRYSAPSLTTVAPDVGELARTAARTLIRRIEQPGASTERHIIGHRLLIRESSAVSV